MKFFVPLVTPFTDDTSSLSEIRFARLIKAHMARGAAGFVVCARSAEVHALSLSERKQITEWAVREAHGIPVVVNVTSMTTAAVVDLAQHSDRHGATAVVFNAPPLVTLTPDELSAFITAVRRHGNILSACFERTATNEEPLVSFQAGALPDSQWAHLAVLHNTTADEFSMPDSICSPIAHFGADTAAKLVDAWPRFEARVKALFGHGGTFRVGKAACDRLGIDIGHTRGPVRDLDDRGQQILDSVWNEVSSG